MLSCSAGRVGFDHQVVWGSTCFARFVNAKGEERVERLLVWSTSWSRGTPLWRCRAALRDGAVEAWTVIGRWTEEAGWNFGRVNVRLPEIEDWHAKWHRPNLKAV